MITATQFAADENHEELFTRDNSTRQVKFFYTPKGIFINGEFPWHWHTDLEVDFVARGSAVFSTADRSFSLSAGDAVFTNSGELHSYRTENANECKILAVLFSSLSLGYSYNEENFNKYILPVLNSGISAIEFRSHNPRDNGALLAIGRIFSLAEMEPFAFELKAQSELISIWCAIMERVNGISGEETTHRVERRISDSVRFKKFIAFIHENYHNAITLGEIADAASVGERECSRCFNRCIHKSPMEYLNTYRIQMACQLLVDSHLNISEISGRCGFSSVGYFGKVFKRQIGYSPKKYAKRFLL